MKTCHRISNLPIMIVDVCRKLTGHAFAREVRLLLGTAAVESNLTHRRQLGSGPARGLWQMEPGMTGAADIFENYLRFRPDRYRKLVQIWLELSNVPFFSPSVEELAYHLERYDDIACALARLKFLRVPEAIPEGVDAQSRYWKKHYNTIKGKGEPEDYVKSWGACNCDVMMDSIESQLVDE